MTDHPPQQGYPSAPQSPQPSAYPAPPLVRPSSGAASWYAGLLIFCFLPFISSKLLPKYLGAEDTKLNSWIMHHILVGMVKRAFNPGCKFDELMVLTGVQGVGKTSFIEKLALFPEWYCSLNNIKGKDAVSNLVGKIVVELEEFVALRNAKSADEAKLFISARTSTVRLPYERFSTDVKRTCILIATTNDATFLGDFSGERRYLPIKVNAENIQIPLMYDSENILYWQLSQEKSMRKS